MGQTRSQPGSNITPDQMSKLNPAQHAQVKAQLLKAQDPSNASNNKIQQPRPMLSTDEIRARMSDPARIARLNAMSTEIEKTLPSGQPIHLPPPVRTGLQQSLQQHLQTIKKVELALRIFYASYEEGGSEGLIRQIMTARALVFRQLNMNDGSLKDPVTLSTDGFKHHVRQIVGFVTKVFSKMNASAQAGSQPTQPGPGPAANTPPAQLTVGNLKIVEQQQRHQKAPPPPTTDRPPFPLGGGQSPRGVPTYFEGAPTVKHIVLPDKKRARMEPSSQTSTPGPKASPRMSSGNGNSPEIKRQPPPEKEVPQRPTFKCKSTDCEYSVRGFDTQAELEAHVSLVHAMIDNPLQFTLDSMADLLDVDQKTGEPKVNPAASKPVAKAAPVAPRVPAQVSKPEQTTGAVQHALTPAGLQATSTPMGRIPTQTGLKSSPSHNLLKTPQTMVKVATPGTGAQAKATPTSAAKMTLKETLPAVPSEPEKADEQQQPLIPMSLFDYSHEDIYAALDANDAFTVLDLKDEDNAWVLRSRPSSPMTTPESSNKDTPSTRQSDISENDNLHIDLNMKDVEMPDAWTMGVYGDALPLDMQLSDDLQTLGVTLPPMDSDDMMLFPSLMDLDTLGKTMDSMGDQSTSVF
jgi:hypothetical protein